MRLVSAAVCEASGVEACGAASYISMLLSEYAPGLCSGQMCEESGVEVCGAAGGSRSCCARSACRRISIVSCCHAAIGAHITTIHINSSRYLLLRCCCYQCGQSRKAANEG